MFVHRLNVEQQGAFLYLAEKLISVDGDISAEESALIGLLESQLDRKATSIPVLPNELPGLFATKESCAALLLELLGLAHADADYHLAERDFVSLLAVQLGVSDYSLKAMESWVVKQLLLAREAEQFFGE
jgi:hypothetical protein